MSNFSPKLERIVVLLSINTKREYHFTTSIRKLAKGHKKLTEFFDIRQKNTYGKNKISKFISEWLGQTRPDLGGPYFSSAFCSLRMKLLQGDQIDFGQFF
jgi:hypothetical protein